MIIVISIEGPVPPTSASYASEEARIKAERKYSDVTKYDTNGIVFFDENLVASWN